MHNRQAVANRLKIVINLLVRSLRKFSLEPEIRLLSIASGSAQAVVMAIKKSGLTNVRVVLIDNDRTAIDEAKRLVASEMLTNKSTFHVGTTAAVSRQTSSGTPGGPSTAAVQGQITRFKWKTDAPGFVDRH